MKKAILILFCFLILSSCGTVGPIDLPKNEPVSSIQNTKPITEQATFGLTKLITNIKRGEVVLNFPTKLSNIGNVGKEYKYGTSMCNDAYTDDDAHYTWGSPTKYFGNWSTELGELFHETLSSKNYNIAGDPKDLFSQQKKVENAEFYIGGIITDIKGNICEAFSMWDGRRLGKFSGEIYIKIDWVIYSNIAREEITRIESDGYGLQKKPVRDGVLLTFHNAFINAAENLASNKKFYQIAIKDFEKDVIKKDKGEKIQIAKLSISKKSAEKNLKTYFPAVVTILSGSGHGSGFFISKSGMILTNSHVVGDRKKIGIILNNGLELTGNVLKEDKRTDVALIKVDIKVPDAFSLKLKDPNIGETVYVIGSPLKESLHSTVTKGIVSSIRIDEVTKKRFIQSDASISPGNSGGPMIDIFGNVVGVSVAKYVQTGSEGLGFFIPIKDAIESLNISLKN